MKNNISVLLVVGLFFFTTLSSANPQTTVKCEFKEEDKKNFPTHLTELQDLAVELSPELCKYALQILEEDKQNFEERLFKFTEQAKDNILVSFPETRFPGMTGIATNWQQQVNQYNLRHDYLNTLDFVPDRRRGAPSFFNVRLPPHHSSDLRLTLDSQLDSECARLTNTTNCTTAKDSVNNAIAPIFQPLKLAYVDSNGQKLKTLQKGWNDFIEQSRYQTPLDVWATTYLQRDHFNGIDLVGPPTWQVFFLHPTLVYEHVDDLEKGNRDDVSVAVEWAGINWWQKGVGFSLTSVYNDRSETDSVGHGFTLHIKNQYSIGYVHRSDGNNSVFFNVDLLEWFGDNKEKYKKYRDYF